MTSDPSPVSFSWSARARSFRYAFRGLRVLFATQHNARLHLTATVAVVAGGLFFGITRLEWVAVLTAIGFVLVAETLNTAVERLGDAVTRETHPAIGDAKDLAAAAVLLASLTAAFIGAIVFGPYVVALWIAPA
jgi:diacylglycerol kinase (ATP)